MSVINGEKQGVAGDSVLVLNDYAVFIDQKAANTDGGTFTSGSFVARTLNTVQGSRGSTIALGSNQVTLTKGYKYWVQASAPGYHVDSHRLRLYNTTDTATEISGGNANASAASNAYTTARLSGVVDLIAAGTNEVFELQHRCETTRATDGMGVGVNWGEVEVYAKIEIWRIT